MKALGKKNTQHIRQNNYKETSTSLEQQFLVDHTTRLMKANESRSLIIRANLKQLSEVLFDPPSTLYLLHVLIVGILHIQVTNTRKRKRHWIGSLPV